MTDERDADGKLLPDAQRLTKAGRFVRLTSIDELPQLFNILKGEMALIGPRPLPPNYYPYYNVTEQHRHDVLPGITGLAQVNGRKNVTWPQKLAYDVEYVEKLSFMLDMKIFWLTIYKVLKPGMWRDLVDFSSGAVAMVLASEVYQKEDYIRDYQEFLEFRKED